MFYNIAQRVLEPTMGNNHELIATAAAQVQTNLNKQAGLGIKGIKSPLNKDRIKGIVEKISTEDDFEKVKWLLDEPIVNFSQSIIDDTVKANAEFHDKAGLVPKVTRTVVGGCCDWCAAKAGTYTAPNIPRDVYQRHRYCRCEIEYDPGDGKKRKIGGRKWVDPGRDAKIEERKKIGLNIENLQMFAEKDLQKQSIKSLETGIRSLEKRIAEHKFKIANPKQVYEDWDQVSISVQRGRLKYWEKEIYNFQKSIAERKKTIRGKNNEKI